MTRAHLYMSIFVLWPCSRAKHTRSYVAFFPTKRQIPPGRGPVNKHIYDRTTRATGKSIAQASDLQVRPNGNTNDTVRYGGKHLLYDIQQGHLAVLMTTHEARRLATQNTASGNDLRCKAIHDT